MIPQQQLCLPKVDMLIYGKIFFVVNNMALRTIRGCLMNPWMWPLDSGPLFRPCGKALVIVLEIG